MSDLLDHLAEQLNQLGAQSLIRQRRTTTATIDGWCEVDGQRLRNFASNDYLNLAGDPRVIAAAKEAVEEFGVGSRSSPLIIGRTPWHARLENKLADFEKQEAAIVFPSGYAANFGTISALVGKDDIIFSDRLNHASLIDGCRLSKAKIQIYHHDDLASLKQGLKESGNFPRRWIITDGVFGMDGNLAPLDELCDLADQFDADLIIDEAHATGVYGKHGRGSAEAFHVEDRIAVRIGTLSKAVGAQGAFVTGPQTLIDWMWNRIRSHVFSTALSPPTCAAAVTAVGLIETEPQRREKLFSLSSTLRALLRNHGLSVPDNCDGPVVPVIADDNDRVLVAGEQLKQRGHLVAAIRPPTVPKGTARLRISLTSAHTESDVEILARNIAAVLS